MQPPKTANTKPVSLIPGIKITFQRAPNLHNYFIFKTKSNFKKATSLPAAFKIPNFPGAQRLPSFCVERVYREIQAKISNWVLAQNPISLIISIVIPTLGILWLIFGKFD